MTDEEKEVLEVTKRIAKAIGKCSPTIAATACLNVIKVSLMVKEAHLKNTKQRSSHERDSASKLRRDDTRTAADL